MARITPCLENGKIARFCADLNAVARGSTEFIVVRGRDEITDPDYAYYLTKWDSVTLLPRLISGQLRVKDAERIAGEAA